MDPPGESGGVMGDLRKNIPAAVPAVNPAKVPRTNSRRLNDLVFIVSDPLWLPVLFPDSALWKQAGAVSAFLDILR